MNNTVYWYRKPIRMFQRLGWDLKNRGKLGTKGQKVAITAKCLSWIEEYRHIECMRLYLERCIRLFGTIKPVTAEKRFFGPETSSELDDWFNCMYGDDVRRFTKDLDKGLTVIYKTADYPTIFCENDDSKFMAYRPRLSIDHNQYCDYS
jgi:hypothetical protein